MIGKTTTAEKAKALHEHFPDTDYLEKQRFTRLHQTVLGPSSDALGEGLVSLASSNLNAIVDSIDQAKMPSLVLVAVRGDENVVRTLLMYHADPNGNSDCSVSPLELATKSTNPSIIKLLIDAGAQLNKMDSRRRTALQFPILLHDSKEYIQGF